MAIRPPIRTERAPARDTSKDYADLASALIRLEKRLLETEERAATKNDIKAVRQEVQAVKSEVADVQTTIQNFANVADDLAIIRTIRTLLRTVGWGLLCAVVGFVIMVYGLKQALGYTQERVVELKHLQEFQDKLLRQIDTSVRTQTTSFEEWRKSEERRITENERRLERMEDRKR